MEEKKMKKVVLVLVLALAVSAQAEVYDLNASFTPSDSSNPIGQWSLGRSTELTQTSFALNTSYQDSPWGVGPGGVSVWWNETNPSYGFPGGWPLIWHSFTYTENTGAGYIIEPGETQVQTGVVAPGLNGVIRWTAPEAGLIDIDLNVSLNYAGTAALGGTVLLNDSVLKTYDINFGAYSALNLAVAAGDTIDVVINGPDGGSNSVSVAEVITFEVPEPATIGLLSMGALALLRKRR
jgi:hypothetical protein